MRWRSAGLTMPVVRPGERTPVQEAYRRHELEPGVFLYLKEQVEIAEVPPDVVDRLMRGGR